LSCFCSHNDEQNALNSLENEVILFMEKSGKPQSLYEPWVTCTLIISLLQCLHSSAAVTLSQQHAE